MSWRCSLFGHKWIDALDPELEQCEHCPKLRPKPKPGQMVPAGCRRCPHPGCSGWLTPPPERLWEGGKETRPFRRERECSFCHAWVRWERSLSWGEYGWPDPIAIDNIKACS